MKALEKDRDRRYDAASSFAADVQRYSATMSRSKPVRRRWYSAPRSGPGGIGRWSGRRPWRSGLSS